jgi:DNA-binding NtrC family response regulator
MLQQAAWTGNVRELRNVIERACILTDSRIITEREMTVAMSTVPAVAPPAAGVGQVAAPDSEWTAVNAPGLTHSSDQESLLMSTAQREQIVRVLRQVAGNKAAAAKQLGMSRRSLYRWIDRLGVAP